VVFCVIGYIFQGVRPRSLEFSLHSTFVTLTCRPVPLTRRLYTRSGPVLWVPCRPAQKGPADHGRYTIPGGLYVLEEEWKAGGAPCNCVDIVYFVDLNLGGRPTYCYATSLLCGFSLLRPYRTHLGPSVAYILTIPSRIGRRGELNAPTGR